MENFAFQFGSAAIYFAVLFGAIYVGVFVARISKRGWIGFACFLVLFFGVSILLAIYGGLPPPAGDPD